MKPHEREAYKRAAALEAVGLVESGATIGLGTGSTVAHLLHALARRIDHEGLQIRAVPTSRPTAVQARALGIPLVSMSEVDRIDLALDGADEVDLGYAMIKGGGGALLREKIVAAASDRVAILVDDAKLVQVLGAFPLPVEVVPFGLRPFLSAMAEMGVDATVRQQAGQPFVTDGGHWIADCAFGEIFDPPGLHARLLQIPSVVETGLFIDLVSTLIVGGPDGVRTIDTRG